MNGNFPCGIHRDLNIFRFGLERLLNIYERVIADRGYTCFKSLQKGSRIDKLESDVEDISARDKTMNKRLKQFKILSQIFRHDLKLNRYCFKVVAALTQLSIQTARLCSNCEVILVF